MYFEGARAHGLKIMAQIESVCCAIHLRLLLFLLLRRLGLLLRDLRRAEVGVVHLSAPTLGAARFRGRREVARATSNYPASQEYSTQVGLR